MRKHYGLAILSLLTAFPVLAAAPDDNQCGTVHVGTPGLGAICRNGGSNSIYPFLEAIINYLITIIAALAVLSIIIGAIQYITSQGSPDGIKKAKSRIANAIIGLVLLSLAFAILHLLGVTG